MTHNIDISPTRTGGSSRHLCGGADDRARRFRNASTQSDWNASPLSRPIGGACQMVRLGRPHPRRDT